LCLSVDNGGTPAKVLDAAATASGGDNDMVHLTDDTAGYYSLELTAAQTNYVGSAMLTIYDTDVHLPVFHEFMILPAKVYDSLVAGSDNLETDVVQIGGDTQSATDLKDFADAGYDPGTNKVQGVVLTDALTTNNDKTGYTASTVSDKTGYSLAADQSAVTVGTVTTVTTCTTNTDMRGTDNAALASVCTEARLAELGSTNLPADIDAILADTGTDGVKVADAVSFKKGAARTIVFCMRDSTNHAPATGLTVVEEVSKDGGAFAPANQTFAEISNGLYSLDLITTEMNADVVCVRLTASGADDLNIVIYTQE